MATLRYMFSRYRDEQWLLTYGFPADEDSSMPDQHSPSCGQQRGSQIDKCQTKNLQEKHEESERTQCRHQSPQGIQVLPESNKFPRDPYSASRPPPPNPSERSLWVCISPSKIHKKQPNSRLFRHSQLGSRKWYGCTRHQVQPAEGLGEGQHPLRRHLGSIWVVE